MNRQPIVILDAATFGDAPLAIFAERWNCAIHQVTAPADLRARLKARAVAITNKVPIDRAVLASPEARDLKLIVVAATGTDIIDRDAAKEFGVRVCNVPGYAAQSVAQFTIALMLELATRVGKYAESVRSGRWQQSPIFTVLDYPTIELSGKKLGVVGYGNIGRIVARIARSLGLEIMIAARAGAPPPPERVPLESLLAAADIVTLHCPLTPETKNLIDERRLSLMKPGAFLINTARGALVDEAALIRALRARRLGGAALDVISSEPPPAGHPIIEAARELENLVVTPHTAWSARESRERLLDEVAGNIEAFFAGTPRNVVV